MLVHIYIKLGEKRNKICTVSPLFLNTNSFYPYDNAGIESEFPYPFAKFNRRNFENLNHILFLFSIFCLKMKKNNHSAFQIPTRSRDFSWKCNANQAFFFRSKGTVLIFSSFVSILFLCDCFPELTDFLFGAERDAYIVMK